MDSIIKELKEKSNPRQALVLSRFFKTGKGEYGEGDIFWGLTVPETRKISKKYDLSLLEIQKMLENPVHEVRLAGLFILRQKYEKADTAVQKQIFNFYLRNAKKINNWDLVDTSTPYIIGDYLLKNKKDRKILFKLMKSKNLWEKRISVLATFPLLKNNQFIELEKIFKSLIKDKHDLIHKSVGWMLREAGKKDLNFLTKILNHHASEMPRTMLRYAIEKLPKSTQQKYLKQTSAFIKK